MTEPVRPATDERRYQDFIHDHFDELPTTDEELADIRRLWKLPVERAILARLDAAEKRVAELEAALRPFVEHHISEWADLGSDLYPVDVTVEVGQWNAARRLLQPPEAPHA
jgi:hypothetical protein